METVTRRTLHEIPGVDHGSAPIPHGRAGGKLFQTGGIMGKDPATNTLPRRRRKQVYFLFAKKQPKKPPNTTPQKQRRTFN